MKTMYESLAERLEDGADDQGRGVVDEAVQVLRETDYAHGYATRLAIAIHGAHYHEVTQWKPLPDLIGVLTQIDNMTAGIKYPQTKGNPP